MHHGSVNAYIHHIYFEICLRDVTNKRKMLKESQKRKENHSFKMLLVLFLSKPRCPKLVQKWSAPGMMQWALNHSSPSKQETYPFSRREFRNGLLPSRHLQYLSCPMIRILIVKFDTLEEFYIIISHTCIHLLVRTHRSGSWLTFNPTNDRPVVRDFTPKESIGR